MSSIPQLSLFEFIKWKTFILAEIGIEIKNNSRYSLETTIGIRMNEIGVKSFNEYYNLITKDANATEYAAFIDRVTVHETRFLRHKDTYNFICNSILPILGGGQEKVEILSLGCSTGEEVYTLVQCLEDHNHNHNHIEYHITGYDVSQASIKQALSATYNKRSVVNLTDEVIGKYFYKIDDFYTIKKEYQDKTSFHVVNVINPESYPEKKFDIILSQNMLIYFNEEVRNKILNQVSGLLKMKGWILLGLCEGLGWVNESIKPVSAENVLAYRSVQ